ncbi:olfactory receptor 52P1-like [Hyperolius riggenbachi]|uniref:olfactory receptor 52P1-like n=1 Tax=Hyperolius riggenbachi TaxID=752182 RepID=UPI0035A2E403
MSLSISRTMKSFSANLSSSSFILIGIPGLEDFHVWIAIPVFFMYLITFLVNVGLLLIIKRSKRLHQPMYLLLCMLLLVDLIKCNSTLPKMILLFWFNLREISFEGCLLQMFFTHCSSVMVSSILLAMAFDRYVAVCQPLRYSTILTNTRIAKIGLLVVMRGFLMIFPHPFLVRRLLFCRSHVIQHTYCEHIAVAKLSCASIKINIIYGLTAALLVIGVDAVCIAVSYAMIIIAVFRLQSREARHKVGSTCVTHACVILLSYLPALFSFISQRFGGHKATSTQIILSNLYLILPPMLNPIIYGMMSKEIQRNIQKLFCPQKVKY